MDLKVRNELISKFFYEECFTKLESVLVATHARTFFEESCMGELEKKGSDYSHGGKVDANHNFKVVAEKLDVSWCIIWAVYFWKHIDSIYGWLKGNQLKAEGLRSRTTDTVNYLLILVSLLKDDRVDEVEDMHACIIKTINCTIILDYYSTVTPIVEMDDKISELGKELNELVDQLFKLLI